MREHFRPGLLMWKLWQTYYARRVTRRRLERVKPQDSSPADQSSKLAGIIHTTIKGLNAKIQS
jgi:hypothetical protein